MFVLSEMMCDDVKLCQNHCLPFVLKNALLRSILEKWNLTMYTFEMQRCVRGSIRLVILTCRLEDITDPETVRQSSEADRNVSIYG